MITTPPEVELRVYDNAIPALQGGVYTVTITQALTVDVEATRAAGGDPDIPSSPQPPLAQTFIVRGPRFTVDPLDVQRIYPPRGSAGAYDSELPAIVFNRRGVPWERPVRFETARPAPWLALLVLTPDEMLASGSYPLGEIATATWRGMVTSGPPAGTLGPVLVLDDDEDPAQITCAGVEVAASTFSTILPAAEDLPYLAHVRHVSTANALPRARDGGWFSVVTANRFAVPPRPGATGAQRNVAHLVSLEGFEPWLAQSPPAVPHSYERVRLISLYRWSFDCLPDPRENFRQLMLGLIGPAAIEQTDLLVRLPLTARNAPGEDGFQPAFDRLRAGYAPLSFATATGETTFAWYRGPLAPARTARFIGDPGIVPASAADASVYDPATGLFDQSYAVAFQTGRSLALASLPFATSLLHWRRRMDAQVDVLAEHLRSPHLGGLLGRAHLRNAAGKLAAVSADDIVPLFDRHLLRDALRDTLADASTLTSTSRAPQAAPHAQPTPLSPSLVEELRALAREPAVIEALARVGGLHTAAEPPSSDLSIVLDWLARTALLFAVPFDNLIPDARMLPLESIRFFHVDENWIASLLDGALSVGIQSSRDALFARALRGTLHDEVFARMRRVHDPAATPDPPLHMAGFVLRSAVVAGWPGMQVKAWSAADPQMPMTPLRLDRVSSSTLLAIFPDVPVRIAFDEPYEGLVFGFDPSEGILLRYLPGVPGAPPASIGALIDPATRFLATDEVRACTRAGTTQQPALDVRRLVDALAARFPGTPPVLGPADFAVQMVRVPERMLFVAPAEGK